MAAGTSRQDSDSDNNSSNVTRSRRWRQDAKSLDVTTSEQDKLLDCDKVLEVDFLRPDDVLGHVLFVLMM